MIDIKKLFGDMSNKIYNNQRKLDINTKIKVYYGYSKEGLLRVSFLSSCRPFIIDSTKLIRVIQINESGNTYWTCFDLVDSNAESAYYSLIEDLIDSIKECLTELECLKNIKNRFTIWRKMLSRVSSNEMSEEKVKGLFGELYFLYNFMIKKYDIRDAIFSWGGPDENSKDFTLLDKWYEIKTIGLEVNEVKISSLTQLDSEIDGKLAVLKVENMSTAYADGMSSLEELISLILNEIDDISLKDIFLSKLDKLKYSPIDNVSKNKFKVHSLELYTVNDSFPRILVSNVPFPEITKISYSIYIKAIEKFKDVI